MKNLNETVAKKLDSFLKERKKRFPKVTASQRKAWSESLLEEVLNTLDDNGIFYYTMPNDVQEF